MGRTALVTGAYGLVGYWLVQALLERGDTVVALKHRDSLNSPFVRDGLEDRCTIARGSITDAASLFAAVTEHEVDSVYHLAAQTIVGVATESPVPTFTTNVIGTLNVLEAARHNGVARVVVASSDQIYGRHAELPYREEYALLSEHPYGVSKAATDMVARSYWHTYGVPVGVARFPNIYGGGDLNGSRLIPGLVNAVLHGETPVIRSDGSPQRDFLYASDAAAGYLAIAEALDAGSGRGEAFNGGGAEPHSVREVVDMMIAVSGSDIAADYQGTGVPANEVDRQFVDSSKLRAATGWTPQVALEEGLRRTLAWYTERPESRPR